MCLLFQLPRLQASCAFPLTLSPGDPPFSSPIHPEAFTDQPLSLSGMLSCFCIPFSLYLPACGLLQSDTCCILYLSRCPPSGYLSYEIFMR